MEGGIPTGAPGPLLAGEGKPPLSRLQRRAPGSLHIDPAAIPISRETVFSCVPIPLLSPLVLSPERPADKEAENRVETEEEAGRCGGEQHQEGSWTPTPPGGWQHPAVPEVAEPSTLPSLFQAQCMLASHAR